MTNDGKDAVIFSRKFDAAYVPSRQLPRIVRYCLNVRDFGAQGNSLNNDAPMIQQALDAGAGKTAYIPARNYRIGNTLYVHSHTHIHVDNGVRLFLFEKNDNFCRTCNIYPVFCHIVNERPNQ